MFRTVYLLERNDEHARPLAQLFAAWGCQTTRFPKGDPSLFEEQFEDFGLIVVGPSVSNLVWTGLKLTPKTNLMPVIQVTLGEQRPPEDLTFEPTARVNWSLLAENLRPAIHQCQRWREKAIHADLKGEIVATFPSDSQYIEQLIQFLSCSWMHPKLSFDDSKKWFLAVKEMGMNAIEWGHRRNRQLAVKVCYQLYWDHIEVCIQDQGPGFNPQNLPHAASASDPFKHVEVREASGLRDGGFGILMTRALVDDLVFSAAGNEVWLRKYFPQT
jgi:two-component system OmpR family response regulator